MSFKGEAWVEVNVDTEKASLEGLKKGVLETALNIKSEAKNLAPVDLGQLRNSIDLSKDENDLTLRVGSNVEYAVYQEYGTKRTAAQPFMRPAYEVVKEKSVEEVKKELNEAMK